MGIRKKQIPVRQHDWRATTVYSFDGGKTWQLEDGTVLKSQDTVQPRDVFGVVLLVAIMLGTVWVLHLAGWF